MMNIGDIELYKGYFIKRNDDQGYNYANIGESRGGNCDTAEDCRKEIDEITNRIIMNLNPHSEWLKHSEYYKMKDFSPDTLVHLIELNDKWKCKSEEELEERMISHTEELKKKTIIQNKKMREELYQQEMRFQERMFAMERSLPEENLGPTFFWFSLGVVGLIYLLFF